MCTNDSATNSVTPRVSLGFAAHAARVAVAGRTAAKHALLGVTRALAVEFADSGVIFICVCPYDVDTPMTEATIATIAAETARSADDARAALLGPQGRFVTPEEVAAACLLLASPAGRSITGQGLDVDGGACQA